VERSREQDRGKEERMTTAVISPNCQPSKSAWRILIFGQAAFLVLFWAFATPEIIPKPVEVFRSLVDLLSSGLIASLYTSVVLYLEALGLAVMVSLGLAYATALPFFRPLAEGWAKLRFMSMVGLPFFLALYLSGAHQLKLAVLVFSMSVFMVTGMLDVLATIPKEKYDLARTLRMSEWQVVWEVQILGRIDFAFDVIRQNAAIGFFMLPMVEALWKSEGGIGAVLDVQNKTFHLEEIIAIQIVILAIGLCQDYLIGVMKNVCCPYASLLLERR
jgi:NitT/TauT family transport system permease protein